MKTKEWHKQIAKEVDLWILKDKHKLGAMDLAMLREAVASCAIEGVKPPVTVGDWDSLFKEIAESKKAKDVKAV